MREKRDFKLRSRDKNRRELTPQKLMKILNETEGGERAKEAYRELTGQDPPVEMEVTND